MILTSKFVFINHPKTGSTFTREAIKEIEEKRGNTPKRYYEGSKRWRLIKLLIYLGMYEPNVIEFFTRRNNALHDKYDQHGTISQVPSGFDSLPKGVIARNPFDLYVSQFEFEWWKNNNFGNLKKVKERFPSYPDLSFQDFLYYKNEFGVKSLVKGTNVKKSTVCGIGYQTVNYVFTLFENANEVLTSMSKGEFEYKKSNELIPRGMQVLRNESLNKDLYKFLTDHKYSEAECKFIINKPKVRPSGGKKRDDDNWKNYYDSSAINYVSEKENNILKLFKKLGIKYEV